MICPSCRKSSTRNERASSKCPQCGYQFVFDPPNPLSDAEVNGAIERLSNGGKLSFSREQLVCEIERRLTSRARRLADFFALISRSSLLFKLLPFVACIIGVSSGLAFESLLGGLMLGAACLILSLLWWARAPTEKEAKRRAFLRALELSGDARSLVRQYLEVHPPTRMLAAYNAPPSENVSLAREFDLESYGFDRVVLLPSRALVDVLVANQFHVQHNAAIVTFDDEPSRVAELIKKQLAGPSPPSVYALDDFPPSKHQRIDKWVARMGIDPSLVVRVGLSSSQARRMWPKRNLVTIGSLIEFEVPVDALRPEALANLLFNAFHGRVAEDSLVVVDVVYDFG
ncbi:MAG: hypothetical protein U0165_20480 [Polyangiaceae bacterium]